jgi:Fe-S-cluster-containing dehydrogenase component
MCTSRLQRKEQPACVKHCQSRCMEFGATKDLAANVADRPNAVLFTHVPGR